MVVTSILDQISRIESARARGYLQAVGDLSAKGLDKEEDYDAFAQSMAGNLLWALSGVLLMSTLPSPYRSAQITSSLPNPYPVFILQLRWSFLHCEAFL